MLATYNPLLKKNDLLLFPVYKQGVRNLMELAFEGLVQIYEVDAMVFLSLYLTYRHILVVLA
jgi:hypothetical protein